MPHPDPPTGPTSAEGGAGGASAEQRLAEVAKAYRALQADNEGYRERMARNAERRYAQRHESLLLKFIDILDNLDRALAAAETNPAGASLIEGLILVRTQLLQTLQEEGLERIGVVGIPYDPEVAEAVGTQPVDDPDHHHVVIRDIRRGYRLNGRLARAAQVIVGEYAEERAVAAPPAAPETSDRIEVVQEGGDEDTGSIAALAEQAAAAIGGQRADGEPTGEHGVISDEDSLEAAAQEAVAAAGGDDDGDSLEAAAREAAAMAEDDEAELTVATDPESDDDSGGDVISDGDSLEDAAREAAAMLGEPDAEMETAEVETAEGEIAEPEAEPEPPAGGGGASERRDARRVMPAHPLDDVDPDAFEEIAEAAPEDPDAARDDEDA